MEASAGMPRIVIIIKRSLSHGIPMMGIQFSLGFQRRLSIIRLLEVLEVSILHGRMDCHNKWQKEDKLIALQSLLHDTFR